MDGRTPAHSVDLKAAWQPETGGLGLGLLHLQSFAIFLT